MFSADSSSVFVELLGRTCCLSGTASRLKQPMAVTRSRSRRVSRGTCGKPNRGVHRGQFHDDIDDPSRSLHLYVAVTTTCQSSEQRASAASAVDPRPRLSSRYESWRSSATSEKGSYGYSCAMSAPAGFDWSWIPGTVAAATSMIVAIDVGRRAERREKATADREERRLTDEKHDRRRQLEREAVLRLVKLFREARRGTIAPDEVDVAKIPVSEDDFRLVEYRRGFDDMFADWWRQAADLSVDVELITDEPTRNAIRLCVMAISRADTISRIGGWGNSREITRNVSESAFDVLGFWLREDKMDESTRRSVDSVGAMVKAHTEYERDLFNVNRRPDPTT